MTVTEFRQAYYPIDYASRVPIDGTPILHSMARERLPVTGTVLDVGCGSGGPIHPCKRPGIRLIGIDASEATLGNQHLDSCDIADAAKMPYANETFDLVFSDFVIEHLEDPKAVVSEIHRVLKPGGPFVFRTVNRFHYVALISKLMPERARNVMLEGVGRKDGDSFPTLYRMNSRRSISRTLKNSGFEIEQMKYIEGPPDYLAISNVLYRFGVSYERLANSTEFLSPLRANFLIVARKPLTK